MRMRERYPEIARILSREIETGSLPPGSFLPRRSELAGRFGVTRSTVDRAVRLLSERGLVRSRRGAGTLVAAREARYRLAVVGSHTGGHYPARGPAFSLRVEAPGQIASASDRSRLLELDGVIWHLPSEADFAWIRAHPELPQIIVNRHGEDFDYVSTDHRGALYAITGERLDRLPEARVFFLRSGGEASLVERLRLQGFLDACREREHFYEILEMPESFDRRVALLEERCTGAGPVSLVSGTLQNTGAVMAWARGRELRFGGDLWYCDFDNDYPVNIWGLRVTSFLQDYDRLARLALEHLLALIRGEASSARVLVPPVRIDGET